MIDPARQQLAQTVVRIQSRCVRHDGLEVKWQEDGDGGQVVKNLSRLLDTSLEHVIVYISPVSGCW